MSASANGVPRALLVVGALSGALAVAAGAFGAHALAASVSPERLATFRTGASYHLIHALATVAVALVAAHVPGRVVRAAGWLFVAGTVLFAGSLYLLVLLDVPMLGAVTPLGGVAFIAGWLALAYGALKG
ncbi:MAG TPA: DUF423 domain-containing protein [Rhodothermales bacterium]|nr:DUF423 domain-containing protein [Rhodothermales bacterium]